MFSLSSPLIIVCENTWRIQRSYAHENYIKHSGKQCKLFTAVSMEQENNGRATCFRGLHCSRFCVKTLGKCNIRALGKTIEKRSGKQAVHWRFRGAGKQSTNIMFSLHSPLITLWENAWKMQRSRSGKL